MEYYLIWPWTLGDYSVGLELTYLIEPRPALLLCKILRGFQEVQKGHWIWIAYYASLENINI